MKLTHLISIVIIFACTSVAWWLLGGTIRVRTLHVVEQTSDGVTGRWGPPLAQRHPVAHYTASSGDKVALLPVQSDVKVKINYQPVKMGLLWQRTYATTFEGSYTFTNNTAITQNVSIDLELPTTRGIIDQVNFVLGTGDKSRRSLSTPEEGVMSESVELAPGQSIPVTISYASRGRDLWSYAFSDASRIRDFKLLISTDFTDLDFPISSPTKRTPTTDGMDLIWEYEDAISAPGIALEMPSELNAGPVASQIAFYSPLSLLLFFGVIVITCISRDIQLHPVNYVFLAAGFFTFPLLFAYMLDLFPVHASFAIAAAASLLLVCGYLRAAAGDFLFRIAVPAQLAYMVLFSYSFFFKGLTGLTLTLGGIVTLAVLMALTAKVDWSTKLGAMSPKLA